MYSKTSGKFHSMKWEILSSGDFVVVIIILQYLQHGARLAVRQNRLLLDLDPPLVAEDGEQGDRV